MNTTQTQPTTTQTESDNRTQAQKESDARALADKIQFEKVAIERMLKEEQSAKPMMRVVAHDETNERDSKADPKKVARLKKLYGF